MLRLSNIVCAVIIISVLFSCGTPKVIYRTETKTEYRDRIIHDTAKVEIPVIKEKNVTRDTASLLENDYAKSEAAVRDGLLYHSLETKPQVIYVPVEVHVTDTMVVEKEIGEREIIIEKEKKMSWYDRLRLSSFWWLLSCLVFALAFIFRKQIFRIITRIKI